ncbi:MAG: tRNA (adenosine(37)-N6)-threonylcarbamoyltransferase complex dimerization subunit type 1 TsaB [Bdellovibrionales bacterium]|nr:tRNA (adenosine(37)-N6)-threonylcarbamoyltransferase complex dimerization subunit type 1 TsaB [Bdellovibrionales bacterium]
MTEQTRKYLAWDTSSLTGVISAFEVRGAECRTVVSWSLGLETSKHSERLLWSVDSVLQGAGWILSDLQGIAVGVGPGSFTGLRIGLTTARMLARSLSIRLIPLSSLALLARGATSALEVLPRSEKVLVIACTDATKGEWFTLMGQHRKVRDCVAMADGDLPGIWGRGVIESVQTPDQVMSEVGERLRKDSGLKWLAIGQSVERYPELWAKLPKKSRLQISHMDLHRIRGESLVGLAFEAIQQGLFRDPIQVRPRYLRASEAEVKLKSGLLKPSPVLHRAGTG